jgi:two-component system, NarL family, sensor kinase
VNPQLTLYIAVGAALLVVTTLFVILFVVFYQNRQVRHLLTLNQLREGNRKELMEATFQAQEAERRRLAQDLHDEIGTMLSVTRLSLNQLERQMAGQFQPVHTDPTEHADLPDPAVSFQQIRKTRALLDETMSNVRRISWALVPTTLDRFGLLAAIEELAERVSTDDLMVTLEAPSRLHRLTPAYELLFYRVAQELIRNAIKHAAPTQIEIQFIHLENAVRMSVIDNGRGFDYDEVLKDARSGLGLRNIESRLSVVNGHATFDVAPDRGSRIHVEVKI